MSEAEGSMRRQTTSCLGLWLLSLLAAPASAVTFEWVLVGDPGNDPDSAWHCLAASCGSVPYPYFISKYEVTNSQYVEFLNAKATADPLELYSEGMEVGIVGGIVRGGGGRELYSYAVKPGFENRPVNFVSFYDALRFANWLHNGQGSGDTESGAYTLLGGTPVPSNGETVTRNPGAAFFLPSENEWYKAAYYDPVSSLYLSYPQSDAPFGCGAPAALPLLANCGGAVGNVTDVGAYPASPSRYGTFDQGGNVWEWNEQIVEDERGLRGGSWLDSVVHLAASSPNQVAPVSDGDFGQIGFRVATLVPESRSGLPAAMALAGLALRRLRYARTSPSSTSRSRRTPVRMSRSRSAA
jgi:sulfatase modifying factor 1